jgi:hypothetical protein
MKPTFLTNNEDSTVARDLAAHIDWACSTFRNPQHVAIATAYFNPEGFRLLAQPLNRVIGEGGSVRLLLGAEAVPAHRPPARTEIPKIIDEATMLSQERLAFTIDAGRDAQQLVEWLQNPAVEVRRLTDQFLHGKAYLVTADPAGGSDADRLSAVVGSSNFTFSGLSRNLELNLGAYDPETVSKVDDWFNSIWQRAEDYKDRLIELFSARQKEYEPYDIYLRMLLEHYGDNPEEPVIDTRQGLTRFQVDGADRAARILDKWGGVLIADGVGLGKTFIAGELLRRTSIDRQKALVVAPRATIKTWTGFRRTQELDFDLVSYDELVDWEKSAADKKVYRDRNRYAMVVVDEAHAFRNDSTDRSEALHQLLAGYPRKKLVLLTATPVNNRLRDLEQLIGFFIADQAAFIAQGIPDSSKFFRQLEQSDPDSLTPEALFPILDEIAVRRTRAFVRRFYPDDTVIIDKKPVRVSFPEAKVAPLTYELAAPEFLAKLAHAVSGAVTDEEDDLDGGESPKLTMARYTPSRYLLSKAEDQRQRELQEGNISGLLLSGLLKRFESSIVAFERTCEKMVANHQAFLTALEAGKVLSGTDLSKFRQAIDEGEDPTGVVEEREGEDVALYDQARLAADAASDMLILKELAREAAELRLKSDPKCDRLVARLREIHAAARNDDEKKVIIFSSFTDTARYIHEQLVERAKSDVTFPYAQERIAQVSGSDTRDEASSIIESFAPISTEAVLVSETDPEELAQKRAGGVDVLVATDVLAEGVNLQQACRLINIDLPWNPMRIVQRHGRVSRIGSPHKTVFLDCFFPDRDLENMLALESRLRGKIAQANAAVGVEETPLPGVRGQGNVFHDPVDTDADAVLSLSRGSADVIEQAERSVGGTSGEEFRRELIQQADRMRDVKRLPEGIGSGFASKAGDGPVYLFCARIHGETRFAEARCGDVTSTSVLEVLHKARPAGGELELRHLPEVTSSGAYAAWESARARLLAEWEPLTDAQTFRPTVPRVLRTAAAHVRANPNAFEGGEHEAEKLAERLEGAYTRRFRQRFLMLAKEDLEPEVRERSKKEPGITEPEVRAQRIRKLADELDLKPYMHPDPRPYASEDDIQLIAWLAVGP